MQVHLLPGPCEAHFYDGGAVVRTIPFEVTSEPRSVALAP